MIIRNMQSVLSRNTRSQRSCLIWAWVDKTVTTLTAINDLLFDSFEIHKVLIIAPLRVARDTWAAEIEKWEHLQGLTYSIAVGTAEERRTALSQKADVYIINRENVGWLIDEMPFDYDMSKSALIE